jgi:hypothetical protein
MSDDRVRHPSQVMNQHAFTRRGLLAALVVSSTLLATAASSHAALVTWGAPTTIAGDSDVSTVGVLEAASNLGPVGVASPTVNGVFFTGSGSASLGTTTSSVLPLSADYQTLLNSAFILDADNTLTLQLSGLTVGENYLFQVWVNNSDRDFSGFSRGDFSVIVSDDLGSEVELYAGDNGIGVGPGDTNLPPTLGQYVIGTFNADATLQNINFLSGEIDGVVNGFQLRRITASPAVPEPGTALAGLALVGFVSARRRRSV